MKAVIFHSSNSKYLTDFILFKRTLGYKYHMEELYLATFDRYLYANDHCCTNLSIDIINVWAAKRQNEALITRYGRIVTLTQFLNYLLDNGIQTPIPPLTRYPPSTFIPYIYSYEEIAAIFRECDHTRLVYKNVRSCLFVMPCLLRILYSTGIRIGEATSLLNKDINLHEQYLTLRDTKNRKDRYVPFHASLAIICKEYLQQREVLPIANTNVPDAPFFITLIGEKCSGINIERWFRCISNRAGIPANSNGKGPRLHDLRHTFACHSFLQLAQDRENLYCS